MVRREVVATASLALPCELPCERLGLGRELTGDDPKFDMTSRQLVDF